MSEQSDIVDFDGHLLDVQELVNQPFLEHAKRIDDFALKCGIGPTDTATSAGVRFVKLLKPVYWRLRRERLKRMEAVT